MTHICAVIVAVTYFFSLFIIPFGLLIWLGFSSGVAFLGGVAGFGLGVYITTECIKISFRREQWFRDNFKKLER